MKQVTVPGVSIEAKRFDALSLSELYEILAQRSHVFVVEQASIYLDIDGLDPVATHFIARDGEDRLLGYLRTLPPGSKFPQATLGRVLVTQAARGTGLGKHLVSRGLAHLAREHPGSAVHIEAQFYLKDFYASLGFVQTSEIYDQDGIDHIDMCFSPS